MPSKKVKVLEHDVLDQIQHQSQVFPILAGVDQSLTCTALVRSDGLAAHIRTKPAAHKGDRLRAIQDNLVYLLDGVNIIVLEGYAVGSKFAREAAGEVGGVVRIVSATLGVPSLVVPPSSLKEFVTGKGRASKEEMITGVFQRWGYAAKNDNDADAFGLLRYGISVLGSTHAEREAMGSCALTVPGIATKVISVKTWKC